MGSDNNVSGFSRWGKCAIELSAKRNDFENALTAYQHAMGDFITTPLGQAAAPTTPAVTDPEFHAPSH